ncbi:uncharacterized protein LOC130666983 isoform X1 [Microplitis mediator]|uniref:uncharacterized protein LOC130666983 isoform X1 n=2 Tax=Microplitis mediator TaxID=375433 RepID=UPI0025547D12|nr:uncharacterized protein LOC130666983 isoform X1 [Microplitis mediator]
MISMQKRLVVIVLLGLTHVPGFTLSWDGCGGRLERALDAMQRESTRRNRHDDDDNAVVYQRKLTSAPLEMTVTRVSVKVPSSGNNRDGTWARVDKCQYEPSNNSLKSRVMFNDLSVSGLVLLVPSQRHSSPSSSSMGESCRMSLRLKRAGVEFSTSPIARARGQMRIRTESNFLEPRFASIYAYGCHPTNRVDRQIKRHDKPAALTASSHHHNLLHHDHNNHHHHHDFDDVAEPRHEDFVDHSTKEEDVVIANESSASRLGYSRFDFAPTKKTFWITKSPDDKRKRRSNISADPLDDNFDNSHESKFHNFFMNDYPYGVDWQSKENVAREMEDVFLRGASEALTKYIEHELHPAIKETLMISMGYTVSWG